MNSSSAPSLPGYTLNRPIAAGGMAEVFAATQHSLGREVAVKIMKDGDASLAERFQLEARLVATLNHPHIVHIYDVSRLDDGRPYLSMELLSGGDLRQRIREGLADAEIRRILRQLAEGLLVVHERGIIHRDIKPANILFRDNGDAVLSDFGIAKSVEVDSELTQAGTVVGSPAYSSPEQVSAKAVDARSDLYSLGVVLLEMLSGSNPFRGSDYGSTVVNQLQLVPPRLPEATRHWQPVVDCLLSKDPGQRYASARALLDALSAAPAAASRQRRAPALPAAADGDDTVVSRPAFALAGLPLWQSRISLLFLEKLRQRRVQLALAALLLILVALPAWQYWSQDAQVRAWLRQAEARLEQDQLSNPAGDNAVFYYQLVLQRDADNRSAQSGLGRVAARYAELAAEARDKAEFRQALEYADRGLEILPEDEVLLGLREEARAAARAQRKDGVSRFFNNLLGR